MRSPRAFVYVLRSVPAPDRYYIGLSSDAPTIFFTRAKGTRWSGAYRQLGGSRREA
jgi:hypothetical protein